MRYLIVAAHPDDEVLGAGAMAHRLSLNGHPVAACILSKWSPTRDDDLTDGIQESHKILGIAKSYIADFGCMRFKDAEHHEMVRFIESSIKDFKPEVIITHHPSDMHIDHGVASECCLEAARLPQRQITDVPDITKIMFMEVPSSTDWNMDTQKGVFIPNMFYGVTEEDLTAKINAIGVYKNVIRKAPHPRSMTSLMALSIIRGSQCGEKYAEGFQMVFEKEVFA